MSVTWLDGRLVAAPVVGADDPGLLLGQGVFTTALGRLTAGAPQVRALDRHLARIQRDAAALELPPVDPGDVRAGLRAVLMAHAWPGPVRLRVTCTGGGALLVSGQDYARPGGPVRVRTASWTAPDHPLVAHKTTSWALGTYGHRVAAAQGASSLLLLTADGCPAEAVSSSVVLVVDGAAVTPDRPVLAGTTVAVLVEAGLVRQRAVTAAELASSEAMVLLSALRGVEPVDELDGLPLAPPDDEWTLAARQTLESTWDQP